MGIKHKADSPKSKKPENTKTNYFKDMNDLVKAIGVKLVLGLFLVSALTTLLISELVNHQMNNYKTTVTEVTGRHLASAVLALSQLVSAEELDLFNTIEDMQRPEYEETRKRLIQFGEDHNVFYAYYWREYGNGGLQYIIDNDTDPKTQVGPGDFNDISQDAEREALAGNISVADLGSYSPGWEKFISAYAPVYDREGKIYAVAGVDISDDFILLQRQDARNMTILQMIVVPISVIFGILNMLLYRRKAKQIEEAHIKLQYFNNNLRRAFSTYLSEDVVEEIVSDPTRLHLGGEKRYMTALFTDIKGFASIAEVLAPEQLVELLNYYLSTMSDVILEKEGTIDKYEGDAIVAFFGAPLQYPDHALRACTTAIIMKRLEDEINNNIMKHHLSPSSLRTRIGINSGDMIVGNMGTQKKMNYTIVSNAVNMAARLEGVNKQYGTWILASEDTIKGTYGRLLARRLDRIRVVGINEPVRIYEVLELIADAPRALQDKIEMFNKAQELFEERRWKDALEDFSRILEQYPQDEPTALYLDRCRRFLQAPPLDSWDGVYSFDEK